MQELVFGLVAFVVAFVAPVLAAIAFARSSRLRGLEERVRALERELARRAESPERSSPQLPPPAAIVVERAPLVRPAGPLPPPAFHPLPEPPPVAVPAIRAALEAPLPPPLPPTRPPRPRIEWERWVGVRGAALLSGLAIAVAGIFFYRHAIEHGWVRPSMRVVAGALAGFVAIGSAEYLRRRTFRHVPAALAGAGVVLLYASTWASYRLYDMLPAAAAFPVMAAISVLCGWLAVRHAAQAVAALGILGGFATPLLIEAREPNAFAHFGYVLLLDLALIALARRMRWPVLAVLGVLATFAIESLWFGKQLDAGSVPATLVALGALGLAFVVFAAPNAERESRTWWASQTLAVLLPFLLALELARRAELGPHLVPLALLALALELGAAVATLRQRAPWIAAAAAGASVALLLAWSRGRALDTGLAWELSLSALALGSLFPLAAAWSARTGGRRAGAPLRLAGVVAAGGMLGLFCARVSDAPLLAPRIAGLVASAALLFHAGAARPMQSARTAAGAALGLGLALLFAQHGRQVEPWIVLAVLVGAAALAQLAASASSRWGAAGAGRAALRGAALVSVAPLLVLSAMPAMREAGASIALGAFLVLGISMAIAATRLRSGPWLLGATLAAAYAQVTWTQPEMQRIVAGASDGRLALAIALASALVFTAWPLAFRTPFRAAPHAWRAAAIAGLAWFPATRPLFAAAWSERWIGLLPLVHCAALVLGLRVLFASAATTARELYTRRVAHAWLAALAAFFGASALALQIGHFEMRVTLALFGAALLFLWRRLDHGGLQAWGVGSLVLSGVIVCFAFLQEGAYESSRFPVWSWTSYAHLVPAACLVAGSILLGPLEVERARPYQARLYSSKRPVLSSFCGLLAAAAVFLWINLELYDLFGEGERIRIDFGHDERRDLALSIAWIVYALGLLALGMARKLSGLRWMSLGFLVLSLGKVFLYDLGELEGLYRVVSLLGLGLSLLVVSLLYQRFVFPRERAGGAGTTVSAP